MRLSSHPDCPIGGALFDGQSAGLTGRLVGHGLLIETDAHGWCSPLGRSLIDQVQPLWLWTID
ncbi:hypothetical protein [Sphingomonas bacterium]|uniref:hypothetical protein n=1 Tax=Sphingomonas bacterium TaxID=1895847 RepID=UPI001C2D5166|nr:hypothetical protein [Sphingomonas bacterium]